MVLGGSWKLKEPSNIVAFRRSAPHLITPRIFSTDPLEFCTVFLLFDCFSTKSQEKTGSDLHPSGTLRWASAPKRNRSYSQRLSLCSYKSGSLLPLSDGVLLLQSESGPLPLGGSQTPAKKGIESDHLHQPLLAYKRQIKEPV
jgi:hypothetical protein